jgi:hypothetical protein
MVAPAVSGVLATALAQVEDAVSLRTGFVPDPAEFGGRSRGERAAREFAAHCTGFVGARPSHVLRLETRFGFLRIFATGPGDLVLAVHTADDRWLCSDDRFGSHPSVEGLFPPGHTEVWVGVARQGIESAYTLRVTENRSVRPGIGPEAGTDEGIQLARDLGLDVAATEGAYPGLRVRRGFLPDPRWLDGVAGGPLDASALGGSCRGWISAPPTHVVTLQTEFDYLQIYVAEESDEDLTLLVLTPSGRFLCDDGIGERPEVSAQSWTAGVYRVWVGAPAEDVTVPYRLGISEIRRVR